MLNFSKWKIFAIMLVCFTSIALLIPSFFNDPQKSLGVFGQWKINPGLDLKGGSYLLMEVDFDSYEKEQLENLKDELRAEFRKQTIDNKRIRYSGMQSQSSKIKIVLEDQTIADGVKKIINKMSPDLDVETSSNIISIGYTPKYIENLRKQLVAQSLEIIRRRVDETGTREPDIQRQGDNRILLQVPGLQDPEYLKALLGKTAKMSFYLVNESMPFPDNSNLPVPSDSVRFPSDNDGNYYTLIKRVAISGDLLSDARAGFNPSNNQPVVNIVFNSLGAKKFADVTKANLGKPFAIVLDDKVLTAPVIRAAILDGRAEISGSFTTKSASDLALLLRAGALPAPVKIIEERTVGPSLGSDSIKDGIHASIAALILVVAFMISCYGLFGLFASLAMIFHIVMTLALLALTGSTLTLPGIAGIVLGMGMSVDANVLVFERMKEEAKLGRGLMGTIENGYKKAFATIFDSNITTLIAGVVLFFFGSGAIKGFAVTLCFGIVTSMFTAVLLTRLITVIWLRKYKPTKLPL